ncbi:MAG TPA: SpoVA/SpoVAEb family sporulation membrane protein [Candidatus Stercoripulliclostridium merdipullorum]|uniref:SpoVA/SpoVAEb family sporulation membrane protein n=1 Tax=Candidatus Stercoripulliclostridium merdipullorum TaxID=2840952 RepID=A0A9D1SXQ9_9FIRM|nr:SpoVA/SpoVAEb family sporulation membrane protein [Candidatus Stercoripulliclostridium merdipullorum]
MNGWLDYLFVFLTGGTVCMLGQILMNTTKMTPARILVGFLLLGVVLETVGVFDEIKAFGKAGATVPIMGFGSGLAKGAIEGALENGLIGAITGGTEAVAAGIAGVIFIAFVVGLIATPKSK